MGIREYSEEEKVEAWNRMEGYGRSEHEISRLREPWKTPANARHAAVAHTKNMEARRRLKEQMTNESLEEVDEFQELIGLVLELDPKIYAAPWTEEMLLRMRQLLTKSVNTFPKKMRPTIHLFRKFLFDNGQLIAMAAVAHAHAAAKKDEEESLIKPATFADLGKLEAKKHDSN
jgi:hypothetical protein